jgi:hypothetical protein
VTNAPDPALEDLRHHLAQVRAELAEVRSQAMRLSQWHPSRAARQWLGVPVAVVATWVLSAQAPGTTPSDVEQRLKALESLVRRGPGNSTQVTGPFDVMGTGGKTVLRVGGPRAARAQVNIYEEPGFPSAIFMVNGPAGNELVSLGSNSEGVGALAVKDAAGNVRALMNGRGAVVVMDEAKKYQVGMATKGGIPSLAVWYGDQRVAELMADETSGGAGQLKITSAQGQALAQVSGGSDGAGTVKVMSAAGKPTASLLGGVRGAGSVVIANGSSKPVAELSVAGDGRGLVQVFGASSEPVAVLTRAPDAPGGLLQISSRGGAVANLTVSARGSGYLQLSSPSGEPTIEAGTSPSGEGIVRVGPKYKCHPLSASPPVVNWGIPDCIMGSTK